MIRCWIDRRPERLEGGGAQADGGGRAANRNKRRFTELGGSLLRITPLSFAVGLSSPVKRNRTTLHESLFSKAIESWSSKAASDPRSG